jgi:hypothetical protein
MVIPWWCTVREIAFEFPDNIFIFLDDKCTVREFRVSSSDCLVMFAYSYHSLFACTIFVLRGACILARSHQPCLWYGYHWCTRENETHNVLARSLIVKTAGTDLGETISETHLNVGKAHKLSTKFPGWSLDLARASL